MMQATDVTRHSRITQQLVPSTTVLSFVCCSRFAFRKKVAHDFRYDPRKSVIQQEEDSFRQQTGRDVVIVLTFCNDLCCSFIYNNKTRASGCSVLSSLSLQTVRWQEVMLCFSSVHTLELSSEQLISRCACSIELSQAKTFLVIQTVRTASPQRTASVV